MSGRPPPLKHLRFMKLVVAVERNNDPGDQVDYPGYAGQEEQYQGDDAYDGGVDAEVVGNTAADAGDHAVLAAAHQARALGGH